jgi:hypothetical protein
MTRIRDYIQNGLSSPVIAAGREDVCWFVQYQINVSNGFGNRNAIHFHLIRCIIDQLSHLCDENPIDFHMSVCDEFLTFPPGFGRDPTRP